MPLLRLLAEGEPVTVAELVPVSRGSLPTTTSGKIRRQKCVEQYVGATLSRVGG